MTFPGEIEASIRDSSPEVADAATTAVRYHERTKHHLHRYARSSGSLDWATQPDPFRTFSGAPTVWLPLVAERLTPAYADAIGIAVRRPGRKRLISRMTFWLLRTRSTTASRCLAIHG